MGSGEDSFLVGGWLAVLSLFARNSPVRRGVRYVVRSRIYESGGFSSSLVFHLLSPMSRTNSLLLLALVSRVLFFFLLSDAMLNQRAIVIDVVRCLLCSAAASAHTP